MRRRVVRTSFLMAFIVLFMLGSPVIPLIQEVSGDSLTIIDYDYEGIGADTTQYFVIWNRGTSDISMQANATVLEFVGSTAWPQLEMAVFVFDDALYTLGHLTKCWNFENYTCRLSFEAEGNARYVLAISNVDPNDDAVYNLTLMTEVEVDFQYTTMFDLDPVSEVQQNTVTVTYFETANPYTFRLESSENTRTVVHWESWSYAEEIYFLIYNKGVTCELFIGLIGLPLYYDYPSLTAFIIDFENYGSEDHMFDMWTLVNSTVGTTFTCESGHRYSFWIHRGSLDTPEVYIIFDTDGATTINFEYDFFADNPDGMVSVRFSVEDPWVEFNRYERDIAYGLLGIGAASVGGVGLLIVLLKKKYY